MPDREAQQNLPQRISCDNGSEFTGGQMALWACARSIPNLRIIDPRHTTHPPRPRVIKQVVAMFLSANSPEMGRISDGRRLRWNAEHCGLPEGIRGEARVKLWPPLPTYAAANALPREHFLPGAH
jgi:hypothetical protein